LNDTNFIEAVISSMFQSTVTRTAGYNTLDIGAFSVPVLFLMIFLMFIGASSSSTGGGVKTSSVAIMLASVYSTIRGKKNVELFKRTIPTNLINDAIAIIIFYCTYIMVSLFFLSITEMETLEAHGKGFIDLLFEQVSAMSTVGLSTGVTSLLSPFGKTLIILSMFVGRVGALTIVFAVAKSVISTNYKYPYGHVMVG
jgi:trk system potassium uptake protein